jgi:hypothetical protein
MGLNCGLATPYIFKMGRVDDIFSLLEPPVPGKPMNYVRISLNALFHLLKSILTTKLAFVIQMKVVFA